ncbi:ribonuclease H-like domain-containing protein, partial [Tanacetum coccineum]
MGQTVPAASHQLPLQPAHLLDQKPNYQLVEPRVNFFYGPGNFAYTVPNSFRSQATAFHTMTPRDPSWNMDTGASSHLEDNAVRQFTRDNDASVEFDAYGFSVKGYQTGRLLFRCDSTGDLTRSLSNLRLKLKLFCFHLVPLHGTDAWVIPETISFFALCLGLPFAQKSDLFDNFVAFRAYVNKQFNIDIKALQCDHGGEYDNTHFHDLFRQNGIQFRFSCPRTSQQNGKSERMLRTITNLIRTLLFQAHIPPSYWVDALNMIAHLLNILPSTVINNEIPFTKLHNQTPTYEHLR